MWEVVREWLDEVIDRITVWVLGDPEHPGAVEHGAHGIVWVAGLIVAGFVIPAVTLLLGLGIYSMTEDITWQRWVTVAIVGIGAIIGLVSLYRMEAGRRRWYHNLLFVLGFLYGFLAVREVWYAIDPTELAQFVMFTGIVAGFIIRVALGGVVASGVDVVAMVIGEKDDPRFLRGYFRAISWIITGEIAIALLGMSLSPKFLTIVIISMVTIGMLAYALKLRIAWDRALLRVHVLVLVWIFLAAIPQGIWLEFTSVNLRPFFQLHRAAIVSHRQQDRQVRREVELEREFFARRFAEIERDLDNAKTLDDVRAARVKRKALEAEIAQDGAAARIAAAIKNKFPR